MGGLGREFEVEAFRTADVGGIRRNTGYTARLFHTTAGAPMFLARCLFLISLWIPAFASDLNAGEKMTIWIDVRTAEEFAQGHIAGSINIPYEIIGSEIGSITRDVDSDIRVYCRSGRRSGVAMDTLKGMGYANVINEGGYEDLLRRKAQGEAIP